MNTYSSQSNRKNIDTWTVRRQDVDTVSSKVQGFLFNLILLGVFTGVGYVIVTTLL